MSGQRTDTFVPEPLAGRRREVDPDTNGYIIEVSGVAKGEIEVNASAGELKFHWYASTSTWPSEFSLVAPGSSSGTITDSHEYTHTVFPTSTASFDPSTCQWAIEQGGATIGYLRKSTDKLEWYATDLAPSKSYFAAADTHFKPHSDTSAPAARVATDTEL